MTLHHYKGLDIEISLNEKGNYNASILISGGDDEFELCLKRFPNEAKAVEMAKLYIDRYIYEANS